MKYTDNDIKNVVNTKGLCRKPCFKFISFEGRDHRNLRLIKIQSLETKECKIRAFHDLLKGTNPFSGKGVPYSDAILKQKINEAGLKSIPKYIFVRDTGLKVGTVGSTRIIEVKNQYGEKATAQLSNLISGSSPWGKSYSIQEIIRKVNEMGKKANKPYFFVKDTGKKSGTDRLVEIKLIETGETQAYNLSMLLRGQSPWARKYSLKEMENKINYYGKKSSPNYRFLKYCGKRNKQSIVEIENLETKETCIRVFGSLIKGFNPWANSYSEQENKIRVNKMGMKASPQFRFKALLFKKRNDWLVVIEECKTKKTAKLTLQPILRGANPFDLTIDRHEKKVVHPQYKRLFNNLGLKYKYEVVLSRESRPDFICTGKNGRKAVVEVKSDIKPHSSKENKEQTSRYATEAKKTYGNKYIKTYLSSPKGKYGLSMEQLKKDLQKQGLI